jgi:anionic cell wall polymer biosynthesis LytR-Cps2A-Psr (LCP) family protein
MNKTLAIATVLMSAALTGIFSTSAYATYEGGDESETNTEQDIKQKNVGSGESTNNNCAVNSIDSGGVGGMNLGTVACPVTSGLLPGG